MSHVGTQPHKAEKDRNEDRNTEQENNTKAID